MKTSTKLQYAMQSVDKEMESTGHGRSVVAYDADNENLVIRFLLSERVYGYPNSDGSLLSNYWHFMFNNHPFLSIIFAHKNHPLSFRKRVAVFLSTIAVAVTLSYIVWETNYIAKNAEVDAFSMRPSILHLSLKYIDVRMALMLGWNTFQQRCKYYRPWMLSAICGALVVPYGSLLRFFGTCGCFQGRDFFKVYSIGIICKRLWEGIGYAVLVLLSVISLAFLLWALAETYFTKSGFQIFVTFLLTKLWSFVEWFLWSAPYFSYRYPIDKRHFYEHLEQDDDNDALGTQL